MVFWSFLFLLIGFQAKAEYRAFVLQIVSPDGTSSRQVISNLDPDQYRGYYPVKEGERVVYTDTWMCRGSTNEQAICPNPRAATEGENPATTGKTDALAPAPEPPPAPLDSP